MKTEECETELKKAGISCRLRTTTLTRMTNIVERRFNESNDDNWDYVNSLVEIVKLLDVAMDKMKLICPLGKDFKG